MTTTRRLAGFIVATVLIASQSFAQVDLGLYETRGEELYNLPASCAVCHKRDGTGLIGPDITYGPTPAQILEQMLNNPQMAGIAQEIKADNEDLISLSVYIRSLTGLETTEAMIVDQRAKLISARAKTETDLIFPKTDRDMAVEAVQSWDTVLADWQRRANEGPLLAKYDSQIVARFDPGKPRFKPKNGSTYFYENVGNSANLAVLGSGATNAKSTQVVVGDAREHKVIASYELPVSLRAAVHTTIVSGTVARSRR